MQRSKYFLAAVAILIGGFFWLNNESDATRPNPISDLGPSLRLGAETADSPHQNLHETLRKNTIASSASAVETEAIADDLRARINKELDVPPTVDHPERHNKRAAEQPAEGRQDLIQLALLLDCSGSMQGLITQAQAYLWNIVNELSAMQREKRPARLELALYAYGLDAAAFFSQNSMPNQPANSQASSHSTRQQAVMQILDPSAGEYLQQLSGFTTDLEEIADKLFALTTSGSEEYCATVITRSLEQLEWNMDPATLRLIVIAGNEAFTQGPHDYRSVCADAAKNGAFINTIFCGDCTQGVQLMWQEAAKLGGGSYNCINHNDAIQDVATPYDADLQALNEALNDTYIAFGSKGSSKKLQQIQNDRRTRGLSKEQAINRAMAKSSSAYDNSSWDLVDAYESDNLVLSDDSAELPETLKQLDETERRVYIEKLSQERISTQKAIRELGVKRAKFLQEHRAQSAGESENLSDALIKSLRSQASERGYNPR